MPRCCAIHVVHSDIGDYFSFDYIVDEIRFFAAFHACYLALDDTLPQLSRWLVAVERELEVPGAPWTDDAHRHRRVLPSRACAAGGCW